MNQTRAILGGDVVGQDDVVRVRNLNQVEGANVRGVLKVSPAVARHFNGIITGDRRHELFGDDQLLSGRSPSHHVGHIRVDGDCGVGHQRPGGGGPYRKRHIAMCVLERPRGDGEADINGWVHHGLVALCQFVITQPGATARAIGRNAVVLNQ